MVCVFGVRSCGFVVVGGRFGSAYLVGFCGAAVFGLGFELWWLWWRCICVVVLLIWFVGFCRDDFGL